MRINPCEYDLGELRAAAGLRATAGDDGGRWGPTIDVPFASDDPGPRPAADETFRERLRETIYELETAAPRSASERPYLTTVPTSYVGVVTAFEWLDYLLRRVGRAATRDAISHYEALSWLSPAAADELETHLAGLETGTPGAGELTVDDHLVSFAYVAKLAAFASD
jgi:archaellum component FlaD/FlaE